MSQTNASVPASAQAPAAPPAAPALPAPLPEQQAYGVILKHAYVTAWREKLARVYGFQARSAQEEEQCLRVTAGLRAQHNEQLRKEAAAGDPALAMLQQHLGIAPAAPEVANEEAYLQKMAATLSYDPTLSHASLSLLIADQAAQAAQPAA